MNEMRVENTDISGVKKIYPFSAYDVRGYFIKDYSDSFFQANGIEFNVKETFNTFSKKGVLRGLHYQIINEQDKLVKCLSGRIYDVVVDLRKNSMTFGKWSGFYLSGDEDSFELLIPKGFAHGFLALDDSVVCYKCSDNFFPQYDSGVIWNDKTIGISWPIELISGNLIISDKDKALPCLDDFIEKVNISL